MTSEQYAPHVRLASVTGDTGMSRCRRWFNYVVMQCSQPPAPGKPDWVRLPDRVWRRRSALLVSLHPLESEA